MRRSQAPLCPANLRVLLLSFSWRKKEGRVTGRACATARSAAAAGRNQGQVNQISALSATAWAGRAEARASTIPEIRFTARSSHADLEV
jgi:hypothetical protein